MDVSYEKDAASVKSYHRLADGNGAGDDGLSDRRVDAVWTNEKAWSRPGTVTEVGFQQIVSTTSTVRTTVSSFSGRGAGGRTVDGDESVERFFSSELLLPVD